jgi:hypothetical protein
VTIVEALNSKALLGGHPFFRDGLGSFSAWLPILKATWGLPLTTEEEACFCRWTGLPSYSPPEGGWSSIVLCSGRRARKTTAAAIMAAFSALQAGSVARGEWVGVVAQDFRAGQRNLFRAVAQPFEDIPALARTVVRKTADTIALRSGLSIGVWPCKPSSLRGLSCRFIAIDEIAFAASPDGRPVDKELITAARPTLATVPGSKLVILSSPGTASGALFDLVKEHHGKVGSHVLVFVAPAPELNPDLPASYLDEMKSDPDAYESEVLGRFRQGASALYDSAALDACTVTGRKDIDPSACPHLEFFYDASGGRHDRAALAGGFRCKDSGRIVIACLRAWSSPHNPATVAAEACEVARSYGVKRIHLDAYAGDTIAGLIRGEGLEAETHGKGASDALMNLLPIVQSGAIELPDPASSDRARELLSELRSVERKPGGMYGDRADVPRRNGSHGDLGVAVASLATILPTKKERLKNCRPIRVGVGRPSVSLGYSGYHTVQDLSFDFAA